MLLIHDKKRTQKFQELENMANVASLLSLEPDLAGRDDPGANRKRLVRYYQKKRCGLAYYAVERKDYSKISPIFDLFTRTDPIAKMIVHPRREETPCNRSQ